MCFFIDSDVCLVAMPSKTFTHSWQKNKQNAPKKEILGVGIRFEITVLSLKTAPGAFEIEKVTLLFDPLKSAPSHSISMTFLLFPFLSSVVNTGFPYSKQKHTNGIMENCK